MGTFRDDYEQFTFTGLFVAIVLWAFGVAALALMYFAGLGSQFVLGMLTGAGLLFWYQEWRRSKESSAEWERVQRELAAAREPADRKEP